MQKESKKIVKRDRRRVKIRAKIVGKADALRLSVYRSNTGMYLQIVDDSKGETLVSAHSKEIKIKDAKKVDVSFELGKLIAKKAIDKKITKIVFDRGGYKYHGRTKAVADGAREGGLEF